MGELQDSAFGSRFEPDVFYESFQAPKFHDFTVPEEPIDPDAFFMAQPGMRFIPSSPSSFVIFKFCKAPLCLIWPQDFGI